MRLGLAHKWAVMGLAVTGMVLLAALNAVHAQPQAASSARLTFDVASVKPNKSGARRTGFPSTVGGRFVGTNVTVRQLIRNSFNIQDFQIVGGPSWLNSQRYDIEAKVDGNPGRPEIQLMLRSLLEDRFQLTIHRETREVAVYALMLGKNGPRFKQGATCTGEPSPANPCGGFAIRPSGDLVGRSVPIPGLGANLSFLLHRPVLDKTELSGKFDLNLSWAPDENTPDFGGDAGTSPSDPNRPSIFTALQEQLGLKLEAQKGPGEVVVIDHVEAPAEN